MKKVVFIIPCIGSGGAERVVVNLCNELVKGDYDVAILTILSNEEKYHLDERVRHYYLGETSNNRIVRVLQRFLRLRKLIMELKPDTVVAFDRNYGIMGCLGLHCRIIGSERNDPYSNMRSSAEKKLRDWLYRRTDAMVFQTEYAKNYFSKDIQDKSVVIPNPVTTDFLPEPYFGERDKQIIAACRLTEQKNLPMMIDAFAAFSRVHPEYELVIYGDGHLLEFICQYVAEKNLDKKVFFPGYVNNLHERIRKAAMYVSSSDYEGISNSMLEAMAMGLPVVCTDCPAGGAAMAIQNGENGYLIPVNQAEEMANAMCCVVEDKDHTVKMSERAIDVRSIFHIEKIVEMWEKVL